MRAILYVLIASVCFSTTARGQDAVESDGSAEVTAGEEVTLVSCANLIYGEGKTSVCFSDAFMADVADKTHIRTHRRFFNVDLASQELFEHPFAVMTGEGDFTLTPTQREHLRTYLTNGGFLVASAGCSSKTWNASFERELTAMFPEQPLTTLAAEHPVFHSVYDITESRYKIGATRLPELRALELDGRVVLILSPDGLNDTANAGPSCCCCGGNEIKSAKEINVNLLAYALTH